MLTVEEMGRILKEVTLGLEPTLTSDDALDFAEKIEREVAQIRAEGMEVEIPFD
jgi:divalent metal cation (Fe/Co/Zn/Cd) transporter